MKMLKLIMMLLVFLVGGISASITPSAGNKLTLKTQATEAIQKARLFIADMFAKEGESASGPIDMRKHNYVKLNELTEAIGLASNENLLVYRELIGKGYKKANVLFHLSNNRHPMCSLLPGSCDPNTPYRSSNGTCNNLQHALWGSILIPFNRLLPNAYEDGVNEQKGGRTNSRLPNARLVSSTIHRDLVQPDSSITNLVPQLGQFLDHDITLTPEGDKACCTTGVDDVDCWSIPVYANDSFYSKLAKPQTCMRFTRSTPYCFPTPSGIREQMNILTAYVDASQVYGSDHRRELQLRSFSKGLLRVNLKNPSLLPLLKDVEKELNEKITFMGDFLAGDERVNEMPGLTTMHTLMFREHNRIAQGIYKRRPSWSDEIIFQETRRLVIAEWQNIVYGQYLPVIFGPSAMSKYGLSLPANPTQYSKYDSKIDATIFHSFATAAYRFGHTLVNGLVRLIRGLTQVGSYKVRDNFFDSNQVTQQKGIGYDLILGGLMTQNAQTYDEHVAEDLVNFLLREKSDDFGSDLVARNLQRGRDHGIPGYSEFRKVCGMTALTTWTNRPAEIRPAVWTQFQSLYDKPHDIDLFSAGISEFPVPDGVSGKTFNCLKAMQFSRLKDGDRFFFTHDAQPKKFTPAQLKILRARNLGDLICENSGVESTPVNVFRTEVPFKGTPNPRVRCDDGSRVKLDLDQFLTA